MALQPGTRLGPYEVVAPIGVGGMGEVYRGKDTRLDRTVAVKVLPPLLATDPEFRERFDREARSISALTHPNICTLHDVGEHRFDDGSVTRFLVMEFLEGETLAARLERGALPLDEALRVAMDIAAALDKAHRHGVIHRDLKPANVMLTRSGAKLLDFGLAKSSHGIISTAATLATVTSPAGGLRTAPLTTQGAILGTIQYMAPEQVEGEEAGPRSDLFSFGAVLFEMITGRRAFSGKSQASLLGSILKEEAPPITQLKADAPPALERLVQACLAKDPNERLQSAHDLLLELRWIQEGGTVAAPRSIRRDRILWTALAVVSALWIATLVPAMRSFRRPPDPAKVQFTVGTADGGLNAALAVALSPDGRMLAFAAPPESGGPSPLWIRNLDDLQPRSLPGTDRASSPFWSPDNTALGFVAQGRLQTIEINGGRPQALKYIPALFFGGTWSQDGTILFAHGNSPTNAQLERIDARGGDSTTVAPPDRSQGEHGRLWPQFLPDGRRYIYTASTSDASQRAIYAASLDGGAPVLLTRSSAGALVARGFLLYVRETALVAQRLDAGATALVGDPIRLADPVLFSRINGRLAATTSATGVLAYRAGLSADPTSQLVWVTRTGETVGTLGDPAPFNQFRLSPDGRRVAAVIADARSPAYNLFTIDVGSGIMTQLTFESSTNDPMWSPDSQSVMFESLPKGRRDFYQQKVGSRTMTPVYESDEDPKWLDDWSRDGQFVLYHLPRPGKLFALPMSGERKPILLADTTTGGFEGAHFSPDGRWVAYQQSDGGEFEVWVASFPAFDNRRRVSPRGGGEPFWRGDGRELFYLTPDGKMMSVAVVPDPGSPGGMEFRAPVQLFASPLTRPLLTTDQYSVTADGQRFLFMKPQRDAGIFPSLITVMLNWDSRNAER